MLAGEPPFQGKNDLEIVRNVKIGFVDYDIPALAKISNDCKQLLKVMLNINPDERVSAEQALCHRWFSKHIKDDTEED